MCIIVDVLLWRVKWDLNFLVLPEAYIHEHPHPHNHTDNHPANMIEFFPPNSRALWPIFRTNCPNGSHFAQMGPHFAQNTNPKPCSLLSRHTPLSGICTDTNTPKFTSKHPFSWPELESGPMNYHLGQMDPTWAKCLKNGQNFSRSRQKKNIHPPNQPIILVHPVLWSE